jgi:CubicO group peptidase (beta-lactamase class C family)
MPQSLQQRVQQIIDGLVASGEETGLQVAAYVDGEPIVDAWAGMADAETGRLVDGETLFTSWSTTKGFVATCLHILADRGQIDYDAPVASYWPAFGASGKAACTVRHAITHRAGVPYMPSGVTPEMMIDWDAMCAAIAGHAPLWEPGSTVCYHAWTFGWIIGELVRRVDGRPLAQFAREELCEPLGIEGFYLGIPGSVEARVAQLTEARDAAAAPDPAAPAAPPDDLAARIMPPQVTSAAIVNRPDVRRASIPGGGGIMSARAIARHYAMLACDGELGGVRILSPGRSARISALQVCQPDAMFGDRTRWGLGYALGGDPQEGGDPALGSGDLAFGHGGNGGSLGFADPVRRLSFGLTKNRMSWPEPRRSSAYIVAEAIRAYLDAAGAS